jgi:hypothetical protein
MTCDVMTSIIGRSGPNIGKLADRSVSPGRKI